MTNKADKRKLKRTYLRNGDPSLVLISSFLTHVKYLGWSDEKIKTTLQHAKSKNYRHLYSTLKKAVE
ncbi:hypothetical protein ACG9YX_20135 [Acinetobacter nematophilus]|jgi:hypothetical protein|uniref:hypothetical protein n=1 Tax=Acinetobacter TaxID=469 RepID=UPI00258FDD9B|nr:hypothetical protein [Acinetobacter sp.]